MSTAEGGNIEARQAQQPQEIAGIKGLEQLESIPVLKDGAFREFLDKVMEIRRDPTKEKQVHDEIKKIDEDTVLSDEEKKSQLRGIDRIKLFATIAKSIEFDDKGLTITLDFGDLNFAESRAIGAGDILPPIIRNVAFSGADHETEPTTGTRSIGPNGREYRSQNQNYMASYTGTKLRIAYEDIVNTDNQKADQLERTEQESGKKVAEVVQASQVDKQNLKKDVAERLETGVSRQPLFIGDSQMEGMGNYYLKGEGIDFIDLRSMKMETIAQTLEDPSKIDQYYKQKNPEFAQHRKTRVLNGLEKIKTSDAIILQCGGNNIAQHHSLKKMQSSLEKLIGTIRRFNKTAPIYVGMLMINDETPADSVSRQYNTWLISEAQKGSIRIIDSGNIVKTAGMEKKKDGHLSRSGYIHLAKGALEAINYRKA